MNAEKILAMLHIESPDGSVQIVPIQASPVSMGRTARRTSMVIIL